MMIKLTDVLKETGNKLDISVVLDTEDINYRGEEFHFVSRPSFNGVIFNNGESLSLKGEASTIIGVKCARCMKPIEKSFEYSVDETLIRAKDDSEESDGEEILFYGEEIDISDIIMSGFYINVPTRFLCNEDCKGLCLKCGADLNDGDCGCDKESIDPRWQALVDIMDKNKDN